MAEYISKEIREATEALAKLIRADKRYLRCMRRIRRFFP